ncbi:hypothetical protein GCM10027062_45340 [Nocardioides hungaricus]
MNEGEFAVTAPGRTSLAETLRDELGLKGTHLGCEHGVCGACTVFLDNQPIRSCTTLTASCGGKSVTTIEGIDGWEVEALRRAFTKHHALQCGFCTPGMLVTAVDIIRRKPNISPAEAALELGGNICRCTGYAGIVRAVCEVAAQGS